ncbi:hypothetical protein ABIC45_002858 [Mucilaginibacter rubeus]
MMFTFKCGMVDPADTADTCIGIANDQSQDKAPV